MEDLVDKIIRIGKHKKCLKFSHVSPEVVRINTFRFDDGVSVCVGLNKQSRPIDCICFCYQQNGNGVCDVSSPHEVLCLIKGLTEAVSMVLLQTTNSKEVSAKTMLDEGYQGAECITGTNKCMSFGANKYMIVYKQQHCSNIGTSYACIGASETAIHYCFKSLYNDSFHYDFSIAAAQLIASILCQALLCITSDEAFHNEKGGYTELEEVFS